MRKFIFLFAAILCLSQSFASEIIPKPNKIYADQVFIPIAKTGKMISLAELSTISVKDFQVLVGKKIGIINKIMLKSAQKKIRQSINRDGTINNKKFDKLLKKAQDGGFHIGGFALGFLLGLIGVLIAYLINDDKKSIRVKWSWIGAGVWVALVLLSFLL